MLATLERVQAEFTDAGLDPALVTQPKLDRALERVLPQYEGVKDSSGKDYDILVLLHVCHTLALPLVGQGLNGGATSVTSASAGEVSVSYDAAAVDAQDNRTWTTWGQELWGTGSPKRGGLRKAQGPFGAVGNGPPIRHR